MLKLTGILVLLLPLLWLAGCSTSNDLRPTPVPSATGTLQGIISRDGGGALAATNRALLGSSAPVVGAEVSVRGYPGISTTTGDDGSFTLPGVPCGEQLFYVTLEGYTRASFTQAIGEGINIVTPTISGTVSGSKWTVLVYMCADNNLERAAIEDINEMEAGVPAAADAAPPVTVLVQCDRSPGYDASNGNWVGARRLRIVHDETRGTIVSPFLDSPPLGDIDMGNPQTLRDFISWGMQAAPAEHYLVVLWDHGSGWDPVYDRSIAGINRAICIDYSAGNTAIRDADLSSALVGPDPIDIVVTDACLMSMLEVAYQLRDSADYLVASEEETPWEGMFYTHFLRKLSDEAGVTTPSALASYLAQDNFATWDALGYYSRLTASAVDLTRVGAVAASLDALARQLIAVRCMNSSALHKAWVATTPFGNPAAPTDFRDIVAYTEQISPNVWNLQARQAAADLRRAVQEAVLEEAGNLSCAHGLSIYFPPAERYVTYGYDRAYAALDLARDTQWNEWLQVSP